MNAMVARNDRRIGGNSAVMLATPLEYLGPQRSVHPVSTRSSIAGVSSNIGSTRREAEAIGYPTVTMMTCPDCGENLDAVPDGSPCPKCGGLRRDATVKVETVVGVAAAGRIHLRATAIGHAVEAVLSQPKVQQLVAAQEILVRIHGPYPRSPGYFVELISDGELVAAAQGEDVLDVADAVQLELERVMDEGPDIVEDDLEEP
jgi:hypothetical protein